MARLWRAWHNGIRMTGPMTEAEVNVYLIDTMIIGERWEILPAEERMTVSPRSAVRVSTPTREGSGIAYVWTRIVCGIPYTFTHVKMPDGEQRMFVSKYNGYLGGPQFACAWSRVREYTLYPNGRRRSKRFD